MRRLKVPGFGLLAGLAILGSGVNGCGVSAPGSGTVPTPIPSLIPVSTPAPDLKDPRPLLQAVSRRVATCNNWTGTVRSDLFLPDGTTDYNVSRLSYKLPGITAATVLEAKERRKAGTRLVLDTRDQVAVKTYLFGFLPLRITLKVTDPRLLDQFGHSLKDSSTQSILGMLFHPRAVARYEGLYHRNGEAIDMLEIRSPGSWKGVSRETIGISHQLGLPVLRYCYDMKGRMIVKQDILGLRVNAPLSSGEFSLD